MRLAVLLALGSAAVVATAQVPPPDAATVFKSVEGPILKAKTLRTDLAVTVGPGDLGDFTGTLVVAPGNKLRLTLSGKFKGEKGDMTLISDGKTMRMTDPRAKGRDQPVVRPLGDITRGSFARVGVMVPLFFGIELTDPESQRAPPPFDVEKDFAVSGLTLGRAAGGRHELGYTLTLRGSKVAFAVTTWADAKTHLPTKRVLTGAEGGKEFTITETYTKTVLDGPVTDAEFALPK